MKVAVLGCGPAGLMAAHAAMRFGESWQLGLEVAVVSRKQKSPLYGAQYLHKPIPMMTPSEATSIDYRMIGEPADYRRKVYGQMWDGKVSPQDYGGMSRAWDIRATYDSLWDAYEGAITNAEVDSNVIQGLIDDCDLVINSIPLPSLCYRGHHFGAVEVIAAGDAPALGIDVGKMFRCESDTVICNGNESPSWYRMSRIFGHTTVEWPSMGPNITVPVKTASVVRKPLGHDCDCWPAVKNVGRYGSWTKGVLSHQAYSTTYAVLEAMLAAKELEG